MDDVSNLARMLRCVWIHNRGRRSKQRCAAAWLELELELGITTDELGVSWCARVWLWVCARVELIGTLDDVVQHQKPSMRK